ncbi:MAG: hypothetical protein C0631_13670 [Sedimenticola sp.]|nr:MAG: hypothetical protein C0631_13670 [Sedimenticola sp.]
MKTSKLIKRAEEFFSAEKKQQREEIDSIKEILKKLKKKQRTLKEKLEKEKDNDDRKQLQKELRTLFAQRKKGLKVLKKIK